MEDKEKENGDFSQAIVGIFLLVVIGGFIFLVVTKIIPMAFGYVGGEMTALVTYTSQAKNIEHTKEIITDKKPYLDSQRYGTRERYIFEITDNEKKVKHSYMISSLIANIESDIFNSVGRNKSYKMDKLIIDDSTTNYIAYVPVSSKVERNLDKLLIKEKNKNGVLSGYNTYKNSLGKKDKKSIEYMYLDKLEHHKKGELPILLYALDDTVQTSDAPSDTEKRIDNLEKAVFKETK